MVNVKVPFEKKALSVPTYDVCSWLEFCTFEYEWDLRLSEK
jgi:hypothetical protein